MCAPVALTALARSLANSRPPSPPYQLPPSWGLGVRFKPTRSVTKNPCLALPLFFPLGLVPGRLIPGFLYFWTKKTHQLLVRTVLGSPMPWQAGKERKRGGGRNQTRLPPTLLAFLRFPAPAPSGRKQSEI